MTLIATILCGGVGSRLWPVSRDSHPKPFMRLADGFSLIQKTFQRAAGLPGVSEVLTVTNRDLVFKVEDDYAQVNAGHLGNSYLLEPFPRNTAAAIAASCLHVARTHGPKTLQMVLSADHLIADQAALNAAVIEAVGLARQGKIVTFGLHPDRPETGYGYIQADGNSVLRFVEKPSRVVAESYLAAGDYLWNAGMFCFEAGVMLEQMALHCPDILAATTVAVDKAVTLSGKKMVQCQLDGDSFAAIPDLSIDYAVMERSHVIAVVPCRMGWSDIGSWSAVSELTAADGNGNRVLGEAVLHDAHHCYVHSEERVVGVVGLDHVMIVDTKDALLVVADDRVQDVKHIYSALKGQDHEAHRIHRTVHRPWGSYSVIEEAARFKIKRIVVAPGASLSLQMHHHRSEHWIVVSGMAKVVNGAQEMFLATNESTFIPAGHHHRLENPGLIELVMIEVQTGEYLGEDDIVRFQDIYGRV